MKKWFIQLLALLTIFSLAACTSEQDAAQKKESKPKTAAAKVDPNVKIPAAVDKKLKIASINQFSIGSFSSQYISGVKSQIEKFGGEVQVYNADNDLTKMAAHVDTAVNQKVDGILIDHGRADALKASVQKALDAGIPVVAFDNDLNLPGVTVIDQDDYSLAWKTLKTLAEDINGEGNIVTVWVGGFTPMERRHVIYDAFFKRYPKIKEVAKFGSATANTALDTQTQMEAILKKYPKQGQIKAVFATWDEFAKGATRAIEQAGRTDIKVYGIDLSDEDLQLIQKENSPWVATAATDPAEVGRAQVRFLYQKIAGEKTPNVFSLEPHLVKKSLLPAEQISLDELGKYIPGWGQSSTAISPWMASLEAKNGK